MSADDGFHVDWMFTTMEDVLATASVDDASVMEGAAFQRFLQRLRMAGDLVLADGLQSAPVDRADGFRNILAVLHFALDRTLGAGDPYHPSFSQPWVPHLFDWGAAAPDCVYRTAPVRGDAAYRISGVFGNSPSQNFQIFSGQAPAAGQTALERPLDISSLTVQPHQVAQDDAGGFELVLGGPERDRNWFPLHARATTILSREFFSDPASAVPSRLEIECLDEREATWPIVSRDRVTKEFEAIGEWLYVTTKHWSERISTGLERYPNAFEHFHRTGTPLPAMSFGFWRLEPDEAMIIEFPDPATPYWDIQLATSWFRTFDFANRLTSFTGHQATFDDGVFRAVLAHEDPGVPNWLDTLGYRQGVALVRIAEPKELHVPVTRVVRFDELEGALAPEAPRVGPEQRRAQIEERRRHVVRLLQL
jgi:hypothetical protein